MGSKEAGGPVTVGYNYYMSMHMVLCQGTIDAIHEIRTYDDVVINQSALNVNQRVKINQPNLYGGILKEGGVLGHIIVLKNGLESGDLVLRDHIVSMFQGANTSEGMSKFVTSFAQNQIATSSDFQKDKMPSFRGVTSVFWDNLLYQANSSRPKAWKFKVTRVPYRDDSYFGAYAVILNKDDQVVSSPYGVSDNSLKLVKLSRTGFGTQISLMLSGRELQSLGVVGGKLTYYVAPGATTASFYSDAYPNLATVAAAQGVGYYKAQYDGQGGALWVKELYPPALHLALYNSPSSADGVVYPVAKAAPVTTVTPATTATVGTPATPATVTTPGVAEVPSTTATPVVTTTTDGVDTVKTSGSVTITSTPIKTITSISREEANPAYIILECLTNSVWGMGYTDSYIDREGFKKAAETLHTENFGISAVWENTSTVEEFLGLILQTINAVLYIEPVTGKFTLKLLRREDEGQLPLNTTNVIEARNFTRSGVSELVNQLTVQWIDSVLGTPKSMTVHNPAAREIQGNTVAVTRVYQMVTSNALAATLANRDLALMSQSLASVELVVNRSASALRIGDVVDWTWEDFGIINMSLRVVSIGFGLLEDGRITLKCVENIFKTDQVSYGPPSMEEFINPTAYPADPPVPLAGKLFNLHYWDIQRLKLSPGNNVDVSNVDSESGVLAFFAKSPGVRYNQFEVHVSLTGDNYRYMGTLDFTPTGNTDAALHPEVTTTIPLVSVVGLNKVSAGSYLVCSGWNGKDVVEEMMQVVSFGVGYTTVTVTRGIFHTVPKEFYKGATLWFYGDTLNRCVIDAEFPDYTNLNFMIRTVSKTRTTQELTGTVFNKIVESVWAEPYPVAGLKAVTDNIGQVIITWNHRDAFLQQDKIVPQNAPLLGRTSGIYYAVRVYSQAGEEVLRIDQYAGDLTAVVGTLTNRFIYHPGNTDTVLHVAVKAVLGLKASEWATTQISLAGATIGTFPALELYVPEAISVAQFLTPTAKVVNGYAATYWTEFDGSSFKLRLSTDIDKVLKEKNTFFSDTEKSAWFKHYKIELVHFSSNEPLTKLNALNETVPIVYHCPTDTFEYSMDLNAEDFGTPQRFLKFKVSVIDIAENNSAFTYVKAANPAPLIKSLIPKYTQGLELDVEFKYTLARLDRTKAEISGVINPAYKPEEVLVYGVAESLLGAATTFTPADANLLVRASERTLKFKLPTSEAYYFIVQAVDSFGTIGCEFSDAFRLDPTDAVTGWSTEMLLKLGLDSTTLGGAGTFQAVVASIYDNSQPTNPPVGWNYFVTSTTGSLTTFPLWTKTGGVTTSRAVNVTGLSILNPTTLKLWQFDSTSAYHGFEKNPKEGDLIYDPITAKTWVAKKNASNVLALTVFGTNDMVAGSTVMGIPVESIASMKYDYDTNNNKKFGTVAPVTSVTYSPQIQAVGLGTAHVVIEWDYVGTGDSYDIDGFLVEVRAVETNAVQTFSTSKGTGTIIKFNDGDAKQTHYKHGFTDTSTKFFSFAIWAYRNVTASLNPTKASTIYSTPVTQDPFQPATVLLQSGVNIALLKNTVDNTLAVIEDIAKDSVITAMEKGLTFQKWIDNLSDNANSEYKLAYNLATTPKTLASATAANAALKSARDAVITLLTGTYFPITGTIYESPLFDTGLTKREVASPTVVVASSNHKSYTHNLTNKSVFEAAFATYNEKLAARRNLSVVDHPALVGAVAIAPHTTAVLDAVATIAAKYSSTAGVPAATGIPVITYDNDANDDGRTNATVSWEWGGLPAEYTNFVTCVVTNKIDSFSATLAHTAVYGAGVRRVSTNKSAEFSNLGTTSFNKAYTFVYKEVSKAVYDAAPAASRMPDKLWLVSPVSVSGVYKYNTGTLVIKADLKGSDGVIVKATEIKPMITDFNSVNDSTLTDVTLVPTAGYPVPHHITFSGNVSGSLDVTCNWVLSTYNESKIDGFLVYLVALESLTVVPALPTITTFSGTKLVSNTARSVEFPNMGANHTYNFIVVPYRIINDATYLKPTVANKAKFYGTPVVYNTSYAWAATYNRIYSAMYTKSETAPVEPVKGDYWINTVTYQTKRFNGTVWNALTVSEWAGFRAKKFNNTFDSLTELPNVAGFYWKNTSTKTVSGVPSKAIVTWNDEDYLWEGKNKTIVEKRRGTNITAATIEIAPYEGSIYIGEKTVDGKAYCYLFAAQNGSWKLRSQLLTANTGLVTPAKALTILKYLDKSAFVYYTRKTIWDNWVTFNLFTKTSFGGAAAPKISK